MLSESAARQLFPPSDALVRPVDLDPETPEHSSPATVVGIAGDMRRTFGRPADPMFYVPAAQHPEMLDFGAQQLIVRSDGNPETLLARVTAAVHEIDPLVPVTRAQMMRTHVAGQLMPQRMGLTLFALFAALAVVLTAFRLYAVVACAVAQRTKELGLRVALGAGPTRLLGLVARQGLPPVGIGLTTGLAAFAAASTLLRQFLFELPVTTPASVLGLTAALGVMALVALLVPARRALRVDPAVTLRQD